ncbi:hypothetical protein ACFUEL_23805, partial [Kitasatospora sp. NPDC057198]
VREVHDRAARDGQWKIVCSALRALERFGPAAAAARPAVRALTAPGGPGGAETALVAIAALRALGADPDELLPLLLSGPDEDGGPFRFHDLGGVAELLGAIGPAAAAALPGLREHAVGRGWTSVHCAAALWAVGGVDEAAAVLDVLLPAWEANLYTARVVVPCLERMGPAARPAAPLLRAWLARPGRGGAFGGLEQDEELCRAGRAVLAALGEPESEPESEPQSEPGPGPAAWRGR